MTEAEKNNAPEKFKFDADNLERAKKIIAKYPEGRQASAALPLLDIAQRQAGGWLSIPVMNYVAGFLDMAPIRIYEVATFYTMFNKKPVGENLVQVCRTTPCWLRGSDAITSACKSNLGIGLGETTEDGKFTLVEVECLGACANAPMVQINDNYYEDLDPDLVEKVLNDLRAGKKIQVGSQTGRVASAPDGELTSLKSFVGEK